MGKEFSMPRPQNPNIRARLRDQAVDYVISRGLGLSLPLAGRTDARSPERPA
jgi:hypothetical protein